MEDYTLFNQTEGVYSYTFQCEKKDDCLICGNTRKGNWFRKSSLNDTIQSETINRGTFSR